MNYSDSARIKAILLNCGFSYVEKEEDADIVIFDTCSVRQKAEDKITGKLKDIAPTKKIWLTWCMVQHHFRNTFTKNVPENLKKGNFIGRAKVELPQIIGFDNEEVKEIKEKKKADLDSMVFVNHAFNPLFHELHQTYPNLELFFRIDDVGFLPLIIQWLGYEIQYDDSLINEYEKILPMESASMNTHQKTAYVPISSGCNQFCAYCIVPFARGLERYFSVDEIVSEVQFHIDHGAEEIVLLGQIVNKHPDFLTLLQKILKIKGLKRLRYTSPYPTFYTPEILKLHEQEEKLCPHIHIPFQSGNSEVLKRMFRGYNAEDCYHFIDSIRSLKREISITTDFIIGFPWETETEFDDSLKLVEYARFDMIYMGIYSTRPWTFASKQYQDDVSPEIKHARWKKMNDLLKKISMENNKKEIWLTRTMIINEISEKGLVYGYTDNMKQICASCERKVDLGEIVPVKIIGGEEFKLEGEVEESLWSM